MSSTKDAVNRREFLGSAGTAIAAGCFGVIGFGSGDLTAKAQRVIKPVLTPEAFTLHLAAPEKRRLIRLDLIDFVKTHFDLSPGQLENFRKVPPDDIKSVNDALQRAERQKLSIVMRTQMSRTSCGDGRGFRMKATFDSSGLTILSYR